MVLQNWVISDSLKNTLSQTGLPEFMAYGVFITELMVLIFLLIGLRTKLGSIVFFFGMIVALFVSHSGNLFALSKTGR